MKFGISIIGVALILSFYGCSENTGNLASSGDYVEILNRETNVMVSGSEKIIDEMTPEDIIVSVNGYHLTKRTFDELMAIKATRLSRRKGANPSLVSSALEQFRREYVPLFVNQRLLLDEAKRLKVCEVKAVNDEVDQDLNKVAEARRTTIEKIKKAFPGDFKYYLYDAAAQKWLDALIKKHIPPLMVVDDEFVRKVQAQVELDNSFAQKTNEMIRVEMNRWKSDIDNGVASMDAVAQKYSHDISTETNSPSYWGNFERGSIEDKNLQAKVFALPVGKLSDPIEDDDGFHLVKVLETTPEVVNAKGRVVRHECRKLAHIYREKVPLFIRQDDPAMFADLQNQMQMQAISQYTEHLRTNGLNSVVYPYGEKLFK